MKMSGTEALKSFQSDTEIEKTNKIRFPAINFQTGENTIKA